MFAGMEVDREIDIKTRQVERSNVGRHDISDRVSLATTTNDSHYVMRFRCIYTAIFFLFLYPPTHRTRASLNHFLTRDDLSCARNNGVKIT